MKMTLKENSSRISRGAAGSRAKPSKPTKSKGCLRRGSTCGRPGMVYFLCRRLGSRRGSDQLARRCRRVSVAGWAAGCVGCRLGYWAEIGLGLGLQVGLATRVAGMLRVTCTAARLGRSPRWIRFKSNPNPTQIQIHRKIVAGARRSLGVLAEGCLAIRGVRRCVEHGNSSGHWNFHVLGRL